METGYEETEDNEHDQSVGYKPEDDKVISCPYCEDGGDLEFDDEVWKDDDHGYYKYRCKTCGREIHADFERHLVWVH